MVKLPDPVLLIFPSTCTGNTLVPPFFPKIDNFVCAILYRLFFQNLQNIFQLAHSVKAIVEEYSSDYYMFFYIIRVYNGWL